MASSFRAWAASGPYGGGTLSPLTEKEVSARARSESPLGFRSRAFLDDMTYRRSHMEDSYGVRSNWEDTLSRLARVDNEVMHRREFDKLFCRRSLLDNPKIPLYRSSHLTERLQKSPYLDAPANEKSHLEDGLYKSPYLDAPVDRPSSLRASMSTCLQERPYADDPLYPRGSMNLPLHSRSAWRSHLSDSMYRNVPAVRKSDPLSILNSYYAGSPNKRAFLNDPVYDRRS
jgi:hypothetical protein